MTATTDTRPSSADALHEPDWRALEDSLAPICDELAHRFAAEYDETRRRADYRSSLEAIRRHDAEQSRRDAAAQVAPRGSDPLS